MADFFVIGTVALAGGISGAWLACLFESRVTQEEHDQARRELGWPVKS